MSKKNLLLVVGGIAILALITGVVYDVVCASIGKGCLLKEAQRIFETIFFLGITLLFSTVWAIFFHYNIVTKWVRGFFIGFFIAIIYIYISPEHTALGDPLPERESAILISAFLLGIWSVLYLLYQNYRQKKSQ
jgi:hypothetical protein